MHVETMKVLIDEMKNSNQLVDLIDQYSGYEVQVIDCNMIYSSNSSWLSKLFDLEDADNCLFVIKSIDELKEEFNVAQFRSFVDNSSVPIIATYSEYKNVHEAFQSSFQRFDIRKSAKSSGDDRHTVAESKSVLHTYLESVATTLRQKTIQTRYVASLTSAEANCTLDQQATNSIDVVGYDEHKYRLLKLCRQVPSPWCSRKRCTGIVICGQSGIGKSFLTQWLLESCKDIFNSVQVSCADLVHKVVGEAERNIRMYFEKARSYQSCFLVLDNLDSILSTSAGQRTSSSSMDRLLSCLLEEIDGMNKSIECERVIVVATCRSIDGFDRALLRPGRLEEHIFLKLPEEEERRKLLEVSILRVANSSRKGERLTDMPLAGKMFDGQFGSVCSFFDWAAKASEGRTPVDVTALVKNAAASFLRKVASGEGEIRRNIDSTEVLLHLCSDIYIQLQK